MADFNQAMCEEEELLSRYVDLEWADDVRGFECARCGRVLIRHYIANCEHKFCSNCHKLLGDGSQRWKCPSCQQFIRTIERQDFEFRKRVYELGVHCPNRKYGCDHTCPLKELKVHIDGCEHTRERALPVLIEGDRSPQMLDELLELRAEVKEMRAEVKEMRQMMMRVEKRCDERDTERNRELEDINSRMDGISSKLQFENENKKDSEFKNEISLVVEENKSKILKLDVKSDVLMDMLDIKEKKLQTELQNVKKQIENQDKDLIKFNQLNKVLEKKINENKAEIENVIKEQIEKVEIKIKHSDRLFEMKLNEQVLRVNEKMEDDFSQLNKELMEIKEKMKMLKPEVSKEFHQNKTMEKSTTQLSRFNLVEHNSKFSPDFQWKISGIKEKLTRKTFAIESEVFQWANYPVRARAKLEVKSNGDTFLSLGLKDRNADEALDLKLIPQLYYVLKDRTKTKNPKHMCRTRSYEFSSKFDYSLMFNLLSPLKSPLTNPLYNVNNFIVIEIYVEPPEMAQKVHSYDGTLEWTIDNFRKKIEKEKQVLVGHQESPYFYTGPKGYRAQALMNLDYSIGLWAYVMFLSGEFDADLPLTFRHRTTFTLFNPKNPQRNITKTIDNDIKDKKFDWMKVCSVAEIGSMIENDALYCKVTIKPI